MIILYLFSLLSYDIYLESLSQVVASSCIVMTNMPGTYFLNVVHERRESPILGSIFHYVNLCVGYNVSF